jgi:uncharacterized delta-60 repeat protein
MNPKAGLVPYSFLGRPLLLFAVAVLLTAGAAVVCGQSALDGFNPNANGAIRVVVVQPDGKILIGGDFTTLLSSGSFSLQRRHIARLNPDGSVDNTFNPNANGSVFAIALQAGGKILIGGDFTVLSPPGGPFLRNHIARLFSTGLTTGLPDSFDPSPNDRVTSIAVQKNGQVIMGGLFTTVSLGTGTLLGRNYIARLNSDGVVDLLFDPNPNAFVTSLALQGNSRILVGGAFTTLTPNQGQQTTRRRIARLNPSGTLDLPFDPNATGVVNSIAVQADGKVLAGGEFNGTNSIGGARRNRIARLDATTGSADPSFDPNADGGVGSVAVQPDGRILLGGGFGTLSPPGGPQIIFRRIARLKPDGTPELSFNPNIPNPTDFVYSIAVQEDRKILVGGSFTTLAPNFGGAVPRNNIARLEIDGRLDQTLNLTFAVDGFGQLFATAVQPDGKILIGGRFTGVAGVMRNNIARLNTDGTLDTIFNPDADPQVYSLAMQADGRILAGGSFTHISGALRNHIARLDATTGLPDSFNPNANNTVNAIAVQADDKILVGGEFTTLEPTNGVALPETRNRIARLNLDGTLAPFNPNANNGVYSLAVQADTRILVSGAFTTLEPTNGMALPVMRKRIARLDAITGLLDSFDPTANEHVHSVAVQADGGKVLIGGEFTVLLPNGITFNRNSIARLVATTGLADSFDPSANGTPYSIAVQADGKIVAGGVFSSMGTGGPTRHGVARLEATGSADSFDPNANNSVHSIAVQADGKILVAGGFVSIGGQARSLFARLSNDTAALQNLAVQQSFAAWKVTWKRGGSSPQFTRVSFEYTTDNINYSLLGSGTATGNTWTLTGFGFRFPFGQNFYIRARGYYRSGFQNGSESISESVRNAFIAPVRALNISTRVLVGVCCAESSHGDDPLVATGENAGIGGFIITGSDPKHVLLRAIGPSLSGFGVPGALQDPVLELHGPGGFATITSNNWRDNQETAIQATGIAPTNDFESAVDATLPPGAYTAVVRGNGNTSGVALIEAYDLAQDAFSNLANISTRAFVGTGDNIIIAGFVLGDGDGDERIVVRGIGPSLTAFGVANALANPTLELRDGNGALLLSNNDWQDDPAQAAELTAAGLAPINNLESGLAATLPPGPYTALLAGLNNGTGVGLVEVYDLGAP